MIGGRSNVRVMIPGHRLLTPQDSNKSYTVYCIEVVSDGNVTKLERRYSEFYALYKKISKMFVVKVPFPPKRMLNNKEGKLVESRRHGLETYLKAVLHEVQDDIPDVLLTFLSIPHYYDERVSEDGEERNVGHVANYKGVNSYLLCFRKDAYLVPTLEELEQETILPSIVMAGCLDGIYN